MKAHLRKADHSLLVLTAITIASVAGAVALGMAHKETSCALCTVAAIASLVLTTGKLFIAHE